MLFSIGAFSSLQADLALCSSPEKIDVVPVEPHTVLLGIHGGKLCLACVKAGDEIRLQLEVSTCLLTATPTMSDSMCSSCGLSGVRRAVLFHVGWLGPSCRCIQQGAWLLASHKNYSKITALNKYLRASHCSSPWPKPVTWLSLPQWGRE